MSNNDDIPTLKAGVEENVWVDSDSEKGSGIGGFFNAVGKGLKKAAQVGWDAAQIIGEHADEIFPESYSSDSKESPSPAPQKSQPARKSNYARNFNTILQTHMQNLFQNDDYLRRNVFDSPLNVEIMNRVGNMDPLDDNDIKQIDLISDILKTRARTEPERIISESFRSNALQAIVGNHLVNSPRQDGKVRYRDHWIDEYQAPYLVKSDLHTLLQKDRRMTSQEIKNWPQMPLPRPKPTPPVIMALAQQSPVNQQILDKMHELSKTVVQNNKSQEKQSENTSTVKEEQEKPVVQNSHFEEQNDNQKSKVNNEDFLTKANELRRLAKYLKKQETIYKKDSQRGLNSVDAVSTLMERAAKLSNNDPEEFINLMNEILIGNDIHPLLFKKIGIPKRHFKRFEFGDYGMHDLYQDKTSYQMTHLWAYVNYGYKLPRDVAEVGNIFHEITGKGSSAADLRLGVVGVNFGKALAKGELTPLEFSKNLDKILGTEEYNALNDNNFWLQAIFKLRKF